MNLPEMNNFNNWCDKQQQMYWLDDNLNSFTVLKEVSLPIKTGIGNDQLYGETYLL